MVCYEYIGRRHQTFQRAWFSFWATVASIVIALGVISPDRWFADSAESTAVTGTFVLPPADVAPDVPPHAVFARADYGVRLLDDDRAEVRVDGRFVNGFYHVEKDRLLVETVDAPGGNKAWTFKIDGNRLVQGDLVLHRASR